MKYVLDSSVALKTVLPEADSARALLLIADFKNGVHELLAPDVFPIETGHALTRAERQARISPPGGWRLWQSIMTDCPALHSSLPLMPRAFDLSSKFLIGVYDALYVSLAEQEQCSLVTADDRLVRTMQGFPIVSLATM
jgi:predicted nucleic acid-binding protein